LPSQCLSRDVLVTERERDIGREASATRRVCGLADRSAHLICEVGRERDAAMNRGLLVMATAFKRLTSAEIAAAGTALKTRAAINLRHKDVTVSTVAKSCLYRVPFPRDSV
jgi:hypothetical protein